MDEYIDDYTESKAEAIYIWLLLVPFWNIFQMISDMTIVCMALDRFKIMRKINELNLNVFQKQTAIVKVQLIISMVVSAVVNLGLFLQNEIVHCIYINGSNESYMDCNNSVQGIKRSKSSLI